MHFALAISLCILHICGMNKHTLPTAASASPPCAARGSQPDAGEARRRAPSLLGPLTTSDMSGAGGPANQWDRLIAAALARRRLPRLRASRRHGVLGIRRRGRVLMNGHSPVTSRANMSAPLAGLSVSRGAVPILIGRCLRPALPMNRANLRCLGLSVGIAIALAGCRFPSAEANGLRYSTVFMVIKHGGRGSDLAKMSLADGRLTNSEYDAIMRERRAMWREKNEADKRRLIAEFAQ
jgi:hypothetical protein